MRLLVVTQYFWPETFRINELVADFAARGHEVTVLTGWPNYPDGEIFADYRENPASFDDFNGVRVVRVPLVARGSSRLRLVLNYLSFALLASTLGVWKLRGRAFDALFVYQLSPVTVGIPGAVLRAVKGAPMAFWILDLWPGTLKAIGVVRAEWMLRLIGRAVGWIYRRCDLVLAQSRSFFEDIAQQARRPTRIEYFPAWADDVFLTATSAAPAAEVPPAPGVFTVLFAGNLGEAQDFPAILDAAERLRERADIRWIVVGAGRMGDWVAREIGRRGLGERVLMVGRHPLQRMPEFFAHADALLVSLKNDPIFAMTIPGKVQAYFGAGLPVLAMLDGEGARIVAEAEAGLVCPAGDGAALAANVVRLATLDAAERRRLGENGRRFCAAEFDRGLLMERLQAWLLDLSAQSKRRYDNGV